RSKTVVVAFAYILFGFGCSAPGPAPQAAVGVGLVNIGELKQQLTEYRKSAYEPEVAAVISEAQSYLKTRAGVVRNPALILDIDETSLSNWKAIIANDYGYISSGSCESLPKGPCGWHAWESRAEAEPIGPTLALFNAAKTLGVVVFFITGRDESSRAATEKN